MSLLSGFVTGIGSSLSSKLLGGGSSQQDPALDIIKAQQDEQSRQDNLAGSGDKSTIPEPEAIPTQAQRLGQQVGKLGTEFAGDFIEKLSSRFIDSKITSMFAPKQISPMARGINDRAYTQARFGGKVNPWEVLGSSAGAGGQGGRAAPSIQQDTARETAATGARSQERAAGITTAPKIAEVAIKMEKAPHEIDQIKAHTGLAGAQAHQTMKQANWINRLSRSKVDLESAHRGQSSAEYNRILESVNHIREQVKTEIEKTGLERANKQQQQAYARVLSPVRNSNDLANLLLALGTAGLFVTATRGVGAVGGAIKAGGSKAKRFIKRFAPSTSAHRPHKITNWPKYGPKAGQAFK